MRAEDMRAWLSSGSATPVAVRAALARVPPERRDEWWDATLGVGELPDDGSDLPPGCVPYLPCDVGSLLEAIEQAAVGPDDVFVDVGAGLGRATTLTHALTGARAIGIEVQAGLVARARSLAGRLNARRVAMIEGDAARLVRRLPIGTVYFLYCPFSGPRLHQVLDDLEAIARTRAIRVCCVDLPLPPRSWLSTVACSRNVVTYRSTLEVRAVRPGD